MPQLTLYAVLDLSKFILTEQRTKTVAYKCVEQQIKYCTSIRPSLNRTSLGINCGESAA